MIGWAGSLTEHVDNTAQHRVEGRDVKKVVIVDFDDPDKAAMLSHDRGTNIFFPLARPFDQYFFEWNDSNWTIRCGSSTLALADLESADRVVFRRWRTSPPAPLVRNLERNAPTIYEEAANDFIARQWCATILGLLETSFRSNPQLWSRRPAHEDSKFLNTVILTEIGDVPPWILTQDLSEAPWRESISKSVSSDQSVPGQGRVMTSAVGPRDRTMRQPCPSISQIRIHGGKEIRAVFSFGECRAVIRQCRFDDGEVDSRSCVSINHRMYQTSSIEREMCEISARLQLQLFTVDLLLDDRGDLWWIDVNPDGLVAPFDDDFETMSSVL